MSVLRRFLLVPGGLESSDLRGLMVKYFDGRFSVQVFVTLVVIMDPLGNVPIFLALTNGKSTHVKHRLAWQSVTVAGAVIVVFAVFGQQILVYLGITVPALQASGGLLLLLVADGVRGYIRAG